MTLSLVNSFSVSSLKRSSSAFVARRFVLLWTTLSRDFFAEALLAVFVQSQHLGFHIQIGGRAVRMHLVLGSSILLGSAMFVVFTD